MIKIRVPATTANIGAGFDSIGIALQMYNYTSVCEIEKGLEIIIKNKNTKVEIPLNEDNLIYSTMKEFFSLVGKSIPPIKIIQEDNIPLTRGLGSSASCIVAGVMLANELAKTNLSKKELAQICAKKEGHPDNSTPAILGGMVVSVMDKERLEYIRLDVPKKLDFNLIIPNYILSTQSAREVLPQKVDFKDAVYNLSRSGLLSASMAVGDLEKVCFAIGDKLHESYRMSLIPNMENILLGAKNLGAKASFLSGAGPTLVALTYENEKFIPDMKKFLLTLDENLALIKLNVDYEGAIISHH